MWNVPNWKNRKFFQYRNFATFFFENQKNNLFGNISKTTQYFFLIVSGPHRRLLKTYLGSFWIGKIGNFSTQKSPNIFFEKAEKNMLFRNISKTTQYIFLIVSGPHRRVLKTSSGIFWFWKSEIKKKKKNSTSWKKPTFSGISQKLLNIFSCLLLLL